MAGRNREGDVFRESRRDWISDRATRRDEFFGGNRHSRDRSPLRRSRERDDIWKDNFNREVWDIRRSRSPDRKSRNLSRPSRMSPDWDGRRDNSLDREERYDRDRSRLGRLSPMRGGPYSDEDRGLGGRRSRDRDLDVFGQDRNRNLDRRSRERSTRNDRSSFERNRSPRARDLSMEKSVDNWGRELRLGGERKLSNRSSPRRGPRRRSIDRDRDTSGDRNRQKRSHERDWKRSVDDFLGERSRGSSPDGRPVSRDRGRQDLSKWADKAEKEWDSTIKRFERGRVRGPGNSREETRDRMPSPKRKRSRDKRSLDRSSKSRDRPRDLPLRSRSRADSSPKRNKSRDRTPVVDEKSDGDDMVISDDDNNDDGSKMSTDDWENMVLAKYTRKDNPQKTIVVRCMPTHVTEVDIHLDITSCNLVCHDIRLVRRKDTGFSRGFAFVEFYNTDDAVTWMELKQGILKFGKAKCFMEYSVPRETAAAPAIPQKYLSDWLCNKCQAHNFSKRFLCYVCNSSRTYGDVESCDVQASEHPTNTVVLIGLDVLTSEETVLKSVASLSNLPMRSVKLARDPFTNISKGACYLEMNNVLDAYNLFQSLKDNIPEIDGKLPDIKYARLDANRPVSQAVSIMPKSATGSGKMGNTAIAAAQWSHQSAATSQIGEIYTLADVPRLAEYSASLYAKNRQEKIAYCSYYQNYYKTQIAEGIPINLPVDSDTGLETAQAALASSLTAAPTLTTASLADPPDGSGTSTYPMPDTSQYQYDPSSGFYYDPYTKLYYDATSQYYYNSKIGKYLYWDGTRHTYLPTPSSAQLPQMSQADGGDSSKAVIIGAPQPASKPDDKKKDKDKDNDSDRVKVAKRIAKDMEKWAKTLNQKKDSAKQNIAPPAAASVAAPTPSNASTRYQTAGAADIGFAVLERKDHLSTLGNYYEASAARTEFPSVVPPTMESDEEDETTEDQNHTDWERLICLLCKRQLGSKDAMIKHQQMSDLHKQNLAAWYRSRGLDPDDAQRRQIQYRDRASERRQKYGLPDTPKPSRLKEKYIKARETAYEQPTTKGIGSDNLGNKLLQKMGWQEGMGLGKSNQGRTSIIEASRRTATAGLGSRATGITPGPGETYKDCVKKMMAARYAQLDD